MCLIPPKRYPRIKAAMCVVALNIGKNDITNITARNVQVAGCLQ